VAVALEVPPTPLRPCTALDCLAPAQGHSATDIVTSLQQANAPNAVPDYVVPGTSLGYTQATARRSRSRPTTPMATRSGSR